MSEARRLFYIKMGQQDKLLHINYSAAIMFLSALLLPMTYAFLLTALVGLGKEIWDHYYGSGFCVYDMAANFIGISFVVPSLLAFHALF